MVVIPTLNADISTWTGGTIYNSVFPSRQAWHGVPFKLENRINNYKMFAGGSLTIPVNVYRVNKAYTIINSSWGQIGTTVVKIEFIGSGTAYYKADLIEGKNIRDHFDGQFNNVIDGINAWPAFNNGPGKARLDMQVYTLPSSFSHETLKNIVFTSYNLGQPLGNPFIAAATVENSVPPVGPQLLLLDESGQIRRSRHFCFFISAAKSAA
jgi:hypothetical protein